ncbi:ribonuclease D [Magnetospirillum sp. UT-4]|uniref:ribonuclease D n=1 Tax=Magnetospirillum sp. UT-4 TaxID=2681467 RepID=UPI001385F323|nr:ribonuclease H-like domain-containing protein [Magnetospirillum sp. UT-4]CAA7624657.1 putative 3'-5' exonuclease family protein [Magnetospirillum sp. UT-4]
MSVTYHRYDLPAGLALGPVVAVDTETMGLSLVRDRLCVVQLSAGDGNAHVVHFPEPRYDSPNLARLFADPAVTKVFHFARFDLAMIRRHLGVRCQPAWCTKIASRLTRTNTDRHGLKDLCRDLIGIELSKQQQTSDWGAPDLNADQLAYAASDVLYLHQLKARLEVLMDREGRRALAEACFGFLPDRADLDLAGWDAEDIFAH